MVCFVLFLAMISLLSVVMVLFMRGVLMCLWWRKVAYGVRGLGEEGRGPSFGGLLGVAPQGEGPGAASIVPQAGFSYRG